MAVSKINEIAMSLDIIKILLSLFVLILVPIYWRYYGPQNFLWLSDVGLLLTVVALWANSKLLMSIAAVGTLVLELIWNIDFWGTLIFKTSKIKLADYMFDSTYPFGLRLLSLFHIFMPIIWVSYLYTYGYDTSAIYYTIPLFWLILILSYFFTDPSKNINWVFLPKIRNIKIRQFEWFVVMFIGFPLLVFFPAHYLFVKLFNVMH